MGSDNGNLMGKGYMERKGVSEAAKGVRKQREKWTRKHTGTLQNTTRRDSNRISPRPLPDTNSERQDGAETKCESQKDVDTLVGIVAKCGVLDSADGCYFCAGVIARVELGCGGR